MAKERILIIDDNEDLRFNLTNLLGLEGYTTTAASNGVKGLEEVRTSQPAVVLLDMKLPGMDGMQILEELKKVDNEIIVIMLTAYGDVKSAVRAMKNGAYDYLTKPFDNEELILTIRKALDARKLSKEVAALRRRLEEKHYTEAVVGESEAFKKVLKQVEVIAPTNMTVVIEGESGTGKEVVARMIHEKSGRKGKPMIAIDCGAIPESLVESELFGHEKGAFTGAHSQKEGKFELAQGGTIFLDEITNLSESSQIKLLRVLQERKVQRLGGKKDIRVDVRIIAASNVKLEAAVVSGKFREDLFFRLNEFCIQLPPLRERRKDIPVLAKYFMEDANREMGKDITGITPEAMEILLDFPWRGNIRELKNVIRRAVVMCEGSHIGPEEITLRIIPKGEQAAELSGNGEYGLEEAIRELEKEMIANALRKANGNKAKAAEILRLGRKKLYRKMKVLGL
jgi:DNA-binding NtrC family response regulator